MPIVDWLKVVPGYREAIDAETRERDIAFLNLSEQINGVEVLAFTPRHFLILSLIGSPFIIGGEPTAAEIARFLWVVSPGFVPAASIRTRMRRWLFVRRCRTLQWRETVKAVESYIEKAFADSPGNEGMGRSYFSCMAALVDSLAAEYGWSEDIILKTPFKKLFQLFRSRQLRHDPEAKFCNRSDQIRATYLAQLNSKRN